MALNKTKPFGEIWGGDLPYKYLQDNKFFNEAGKEVTEKGELLEVHKKPGPKPKAKDSVASD